MFSRSQLLAIAPLLVAIASPRAAVAQSDSAAQIEFFEQRIRPILVEQCYECHNSSQNSESELALDYRAGMRAVVEAAKDPNQLPDQPIRLLQVIRHEIEGLEMPEGGPKLEDSVIADFEAWIQMGAPDPREKPPSGEVLEELTSWEKIREKRAQWWSFQPLQPPRIPARPDPAASDAGQKLLSQPGVIDAFIDHRLNEADLEAAPPADRRTLIRRLYLALIGLPPSPSAVESFIRDQSPDAYERLVDKLLASPRFGERWARHWMDWVRYAESHGSEGDPKIFGAEHYRDYLIRAINSDVPYDQMLLEHIAGDLLSEPRINSVLGINESLIGTAHWRMVFHGFAPTDVLDEKVRFTDDAINAFSKAFLGLTVSCARCHDHKFDAISQADYYALFGILASTRPGRSVIDLPEQQNLHRERLSELRKQIRDRISEVWGKSLRETSGAVSSALTLRKLLRVSEQEEPSEAKPLPAQSSSSANRSATERFDQMWRDVRKRFDDYRRQQQAFDQFVSEQRKSSVQSGVMAWDLADTETLETWYRFGNGLPANPAPDGEVTISLQGDRVLESILPAGVFSHRVSSKHAARLESPAFLIDGEHKLWLRIAGDGNAATRYVVQDYPRNGTVFPVKQLNGSEWRWESFDLSYWQGDLAHIELTTAKDAPLLYQDQPRSWFGIREVLILPKEHSVPPKEDLQHLTPLMVWAENETPESFEDLRRMLQEVLQAAVSDWRLGELSTEQALLLDECMDLGLLENRLSRLPTMRADCQEYRRLEAEIPSGRRVPTLSEWQGQDYPLYERGDHKRPAELVARRFLEVVDGTPYQDELSGRLELAEDMLREDNPFTARVFVNRVWHHLFGQGIVKTVDNFGRLGEEPSHPELLDYLAFQFRNRDQWSLKLLVRRLVTSQAWQRSSLPTDKARAIDPENRLLSHFRIRRLDAESIRDSLLAASGQLSTAMYGPSVDGNSQRRSVYVRVIRNKLDAFLSTFNAPVPFTTTGRRDATNVPAQSLALMNSPRVRELSARLVRDLGEGDEDRSTRERGTRGRIESLWSNVFARPPLAEELNAATEFVAESEEFYRSVRERKQDLHQQIKHQQTQIERLKQIADARAASKDEAVSGAGDAGASGSLLAGESPAIAEWQFDSLEDRRGELDLRLRGSARLSEGALVLDGDGWAESPAIPATLGAKSMEVVALLDNLQQQGGGLMTIQDLEGQVFDAIVYGEQSPAHWLVGSDFFRRTQSLEGPQEETATAEPVHLVAVFESDGRVSLHRNGKIYGRSYKTDLNSFPPREAMLLFGLRHGKNAGGNRTLKGKILQARLYDRALKTSEISELWRAVEKTQRRASLVEMLTDEEVERYHQLTRQLESAQQELDSLPRTSPDSPWEDLVHAMFNMKEFIYVR